MGGEMGREERDPIGDVRLREQDGETDRFEAALKADDAPIAVSPTPS
jgi:hypothetical protein